MNKAPFGLHWPAIAGAATGIAIAAGNNLAVSLPAAALAVTAGGLALASALRPPERQLEEATFPPHTSHVREMFRSGPLGREDLVLLLDRLERATVQPNLPPRPAREMAVIVSLAPAEFRRYLSARIAEIENGS